MFILFYKKLSTSFVYSFQFNEAGKQIKSVFYSWDVGFSLLTLTQIHIDFTFFQYLGVILSSSKFPIVLLVIEITTIVHGTRNIFLGIGYIILN